jgi:hypothetical protein
VSACNRCRLRKNRCDQKLPSCASCDKANVACVGYDPITKREIPRRLVCHLLPVGRWSIQVSKRKTSPNRHIVTFTTSRPGLTSWKPC